MGFVPSFLEWPSKSVTLEIIQGYEDRRNRPDWDATSRLGVHLRFGTIGIRTLLEQAQNRSDIFVNELIWRDFYHMILYHNSESPNKAIKSAYDFIEWEKNEDHFARWCEGTTGYPLVDAGMRELNATGFMHNRVRMVVASFLTKHLLLDWRLGERYFAQKLLDFDLASNVGGWQWASGSGCDAAPYFRIFNPAAQQEKFDPQFKYIRKWVPEWGTAAYPKPVVEHTWARQRALSRYKTGLASGL
jgi:deoxyribodipyrimidine photo-lyase